MAETILIVDDEQVYRAVLRRVLEKRGYSVLQADTYRNALDLFEKNRDAIALLITDISLPGGSGCELWVLMRKKKTDLNVLFISGHVGAEILRKYGVEPSQFHFLSKPFNAAELVERVRQILESTDFPEIDDLFWRRKVDDGETAGNGNGHSGN